MKIMKDKRRLRICFIGWGDFAHMRRWADWFQKRGHEVHLIHRSLCRGKAVKIEGVELHDLEVMENEHPGVRFQTRKYLKSIMTVRRLVEEIKPDVFHLQTLYYPSHLGVYSSFHPMVITPWNGDILWRNDWFPWTPRIMVKDWLRRRLIRYGLDRADLVTVNSGKMGRICREEYGISGQKIQAVHCPGVDLKTFHNRGKDEDFLEKYDLKDSPVIISARSPSALYNVDVIAKAAPRVLAAEPGSKFIFMWPSAEQSEVEYLKKLAADLKIEHAVRWLGTMPYEELPQILSSGDAFVSLSSGDSCPSSLLEAMACGLPPVTADLDTVNEWVSDGWNGRVVPQRDIAGTAEAILDILQNPQKSELFRKRNIDRVRKQAGYDENMEKMERLYFRLTHES